MTCRPWTMPDNYAGAVWPNYHDAGFGQSRDSDALERSNFRVAWKVIHAVSADAEVVRERHWAVGWVEWIAIPSDDEKALKVAHALNARYEQYPCLDEGDYSEEEQAEADETWANCYDWRERAKYIANRRSQFDFQSLADMLACVRGKYFAGYASELLH